MPTTTPSPNLLPAATTMDAVTLHVRDVDAMVTFYTHVIGLTVLHSDNSTSTARDQRPGVYTLGHETTPIVVLRHTPDLPAAHPGQAGLFHTAILYPTQHDLAVTLLRVAQSAPHLFTGSADHLVSQAFYLNDPEGNGIELYWDRPRDTWRWTPQGHVVMDTLWLDPNTFITEHLGDTPQAASVSAASVGHVNLQVGDTNAAAQFYSQALGFEPTAQVPGALFVAAGGYHHHMAMNTWRSQGAGPRASSLGLGEVSLVLPHTDDIAALTDRLNFHNVAHHHNGAALIFHDPWNNSLAVTAADN